MVIKEGTPSQVVFHLKLESNVLWADLRCRKLPYKSFQDMLMSAIVREPRLLEVQEGSLMDYHVRFGHLSFNTVERTAREPESVIKLTDLTRVNCQICAEGKASKSRQSKQDSGRKLANRSRGKRHLQ